MTSPVSPELSAKIDLWRARAAEGTLSIEDMREAFLALRAGRVAAASASSTSRAKAAKVAIPSAEDMLKELGL